MLIDYCTVPSERYFCVPLLFSFVYCTVPSNCYLVFHLVFSCILYCSLVYCISLVLFLFFCVMKIKYIMYIMLKNTAFFIINLFAWLYGMFGILFTCGKHLHGRIISLIYEVWAHETSLNPLFLFYWSTCTKSGKWTVMRLCWIMESFWQCDMFCISFCCSSKWYLCFISVLFCVSIAPFTIINRIKT